MRATNSKFNALKITLMTLVVVMSVSVGVFGQGRGRGGDRDRWGDRGRGGDHGLGKKCGKFVNCHDARDGRWDGRGPRRGFRDDRDFEEFDPSVKTIGADTGMAATLPAPLFFVTAAGSDTGTRGILDTF